MARIGKHVWCPRVVIEELEDIKVEHGIDEDAYALRKLVEHARVGREADRIMKLDFKRRPIKTPIFDDRAMVRPKTNKSRRMCCLL
jgi:hypothetical protein